MRKRKKILILAANPRVTEPLRLDIEVRTIDEAIRRCGQREHFEIKPQWAVRAKDLRRALLDYKPQIVHFSGHGAGEEGLVIESDDQNISNRVTAQALANLLSEFRSVQCVLLNACYSHVQAQQIHQYIDYVIGMNQAINDSSAIAFAEGFYDALGAGRSYEEAYRLGCNAIELVTGSQPGRRLQIVNSEQTNREPVLLKRIPPIHPRNRFTKPIVITAVVASLLALTAFTLRIANPVCFLNQSFAPECIFSWEYNQRFSSGERVLFNNNNSDLKSGVLLFADKQYTKAKENFLNAVTASRNDPEAQIYLNNSKAREQGNPYLIAVVVPVDQDSDSAQEMLRGVADAQSDFNEQGKDARFLEIKIVNDGNDPEVAKQVSYVLANSSEVLGVIGHNSTEATKAALPVHEELGLVMISPTSSGNDISGKTFLRTIPSETDYAERLAAYAAELGIKHAAIFYDASGGGLGESSKKSFTNEFTLRGGKVDQSFPLSQSNLEDLVKNVFEGGETEAIMLFPSKETVSVAVRVAKAVAEENNNLATGQKRKLVMGSNPLYDSDTLIDGGDAVDGLILAVPWFPRTDYVYAKKACDRWEGQISWRTASSFDATQVIIKTLSQTITRNDILRQFQEYKNGEEVDLSPLYTSGEPLLFNTQGERLLNPQLVKVDREGNHPQYASLGFISLDDMGKNPCARDPTSG